MKIHYKEIKGYKYQLLNTYNIYLPELNLNDVNLADSLNEIKDFLSINNNNYLFINKGYAWNGASGPVINTKNILRASLVHDALYQLITTSVLPQSSKNSSDDIFYRLCLEDGVSNLRAKYMLYGLKVFGGAYIKPIKPETVVKTFP